MEYVYAALILNETGEEINEDNVTGVLEAAGVDVEESRVKALAADADASADETDDDEEDEADAAEEAADDDDEDEGDGGEGLGELFG
ncbi:50S ribosomal protein P1 [Halobacteriales archaeon SW_8_68_21]|nr:MAG: 50S ribosomal protein P1 [Halobacteriales archaeon SW_8_68_21]